MEFVYDNSAENPRNPSHPPQRVQAGFTPTDEMGLLFLQLIPDERGGHAKLEQAHRERLAARVNDAIEQRRRAAENSNRP
jgi:hypothetical protein